VQIVYQKQGNWFVGHIQEYLDYETQGRTIEELKANLIDIYQDISSGLVPDAAEGQTVVRYVNVVTPFSG
jgi:hypothetical protein